jgi:hypothetical protein
MALDTGLAIGLITLIVHQFVDDMLSTYLLLLQ